PPDRFRIRTQAVRGGNLVRLRLIVMGCALVALSVGVGACGGGGGGGGNKAKGGTLTIYSSLPLQGTTRGNSLDVIKGEKLALSQNNIKGGSCNVQYKSLDDSTVQAGQWDPGQ